MTLDEIIEREYIIAEENQKIVDTQIVFDDVSILELYCDDTEVIEEHLNNYKKCAEYHKQIAECLKDYKRLKSIPEHNYDNCHNATCRRKCRKDGYEHAVDDLVEKINELEEIYKEKYGCEIVEMYSDVVSELKEWIADQLKTGASND